MSCLDPNELLGFVEGRLDRGALVTVDAHLATCGDCREVVAALARGSAPVPTPHPGDQLAGGRAGRYLLLESIGSGAMGDVHAAWDPELDRRIAVKLLRPDLGDRVSDDARQRMIREGRAIAKLAHPNVVAVHDVGAFEDGVFIAMEYVDGGTLAAWRGTAHTSDQVISAFEQAARGLAAAHRAGLIHRDVKPSNLLVGSDDRVRVVDFGLAAPRDATDLAVTRSGGIVGTPLYMAPEVLAGAVADQRSDQYGFAASLYEILSGVAPFSGRTLAELRHDKATMSLGQPSRRVPPPVLAAIRRGLAPDPAMRWPSMDQFADRLVSHLHRRRRRFVLVGVAAIIVTTVVVARFMRTEDRCTNGAERLGDVWNRVRAAEVRSTAGPLVATRLGTYGDTWVDGYRRVCEATHVHGHQSEALLDIRMRCLDARRAAFGALIRVLTTRSDLVTREHAVTAAAALSPISECDAVDSLVAIARSPAYLAAPVAAAQHLVDEAEALARAGHFADARATLMRVPSLQFRTLDARVGLLRGSIEQELGDMQAAEAALQQAAQAAAEAHDDLVAAKAWTLLVGVVGFLGNRPAEGLALARVAEAAVARAGSDDSLAAELASMRGLVFDGLGNFAEARTQHERALEIRERTLGDNALEVAQVLDNLGAIPLQQRQFGDAEPIYARALAIRRHHLGEDHPDVAASWNSLGAAQRGLGRLTDARDSYARASAIWRRSLGDAHPNVAATLVNLGNLERDLGQLEAAQHHFEAAIETYRRADPTLYAADIATATGGLGNVAYARHDLEGAEASLVGAISMLEEALGPSHPRIATQLENLARVKRDRGDLAASDQLLARAKTLREAATK